MIDLKIMSDEFKRWFADQTPDTQQELHGVYDGAGTDPAISAISGRADYFRGWVTVTYAHDVLGFELP